MKKFIAGVVVGGMLFGGVSVFAAELKNVIFNIDSVVVDGQKAMIQSKNKPFTFQNYGYFPSYMLNELGYKPSRSSDGRTVFLETTGKNYYPIFTDIGGIAKNERIPAKEIINHSSSVSISHENGEAIRSPLGGRTMSYIMTSLNKVEDGGVPKSEVSFQLGEKYRQFKATAALITHKTSFLPSDPVTLRIYVTDESGQQSLYASHILNQGKEAATVTVPLRYVESIMFSVTGSGSSEAEFALLDPVFVK
ncbi:hypothetical protein DNH61_16585 [Paenibacillus sambharensis]|uniref:Uncharacterized protein n=1 Tax=Paenibacillus sambharensis TaxID=1803190 RepID=A0A2W1LJ70_9BACL|nr:NPCBM/NEW2 domain-containing protein [Paenibacillus sambharensis]PZD94584.1 hypothetical protein DNH61_16585 [Paenibacillus sambharensis]